MTIHREVTISILLFNQTQTLLSVRELDRRKLFVGCSSSGVVAVQQCYRNVMTPVYLNCHHSHTVASSGQWPVYSSSILILLLAGPGLSLIHSPVKPLLLSSTISSKSSQARQVVTQFVYCTVQYCTVPYTLHTQIREERTDKIGTVQPVYLPLFALTAHIF